MAADYTREQLLGALRRADAAGDAEAARAIARRLAAGRQAPQADFSDVQSNVMTTEAIGRNPAQDSAFAQMITGGARRPAATVTPTLMPGQTVPNARPYSGPLLTQSPRPNIAPTPASMAARAEMDRAAALPALSPMEARQRSFRQANLPTRVLAGAGSRVADMAMGFGQLTGLTNEADALAQRQNNAFMEGDLAASGGKIAGDIAMLAAPLSKVGALPRVGQYATSAAAGAGMGLLEPVVDGESRTLNTALGGGLGLLGQAGSDAVMAVGKRAAKAITPELRELARYGESIGLPLTGADVAQSESIKRLASLADALPLSGAAGRQAKRSETVGRQVAKLLGQDADTLNQGVMAKAYADLGNQYDEFFKEGMAVDRGLVDEVTKIRDFAAENLDETATRAASNFVQRVSEQMKAGGRISGETLQSLDQQARKLATGGGDRQQVMQELRTALHEAFGRQGGKGDAWRALNQRYANYKTVEPLIARNPEGIAPEQLLQAVNATKAGKARMARGQAGDIGDLALLGRQMRPPRTSKTPEGLLNLALGAGSALAPQVAIPLGLLGNVGGRVLNSPAAGRFLLREGRGQGAQRLAPYLRPAAVPAGGLLSEDAQQWLNDPRNRP